MIKIIVIVVLVLIAAVLVFAATQPDTFRVQRSVSIQAPPERIFPFIDDFHRWTAWSPYEKMDPGMKRTFSGTASGLGATYAWEGTGKVGAGRMKIAESSPPSKVTIDLHFIKPFEGDTTAMFTLEPKGGSTNVTWAMDGRNTYIMKVVHVFIDPEKMVGKDFEQGLANLKVAAEK
jgi:carbon monoxide dehydrogenase subunit G